MTQEAKKPGLADRRGYHHGHLREALVEAARRLIAERGPAGFTLSDAAKLAGVSPAAPYRHFKDRQSLLREVARRGFEAFGARLTAAAQAGGEQGFLAMGKAYLAFAREEPAYYAAMFNTGRAGGPPLSGDAAPMPLLREAVARALGTSDETLARFAANLVFALTHGLATLSAAGPATVPGGLTDCEYMLEVGVEALMKGLPSALDPEELSRIALPES